MAFAVCTVQNISQLDSVPVAKIIDYPLEQRDYKPYAQANLARMGGELLLRVWAFEVSPEPVSELRAVLYLFDDPELALSVSARADGGNTVQLMRGGIEQKPLALPGDAEVHDHAGEDLQGVYWGRMFHLPVPWLRDVGGAVRLEAGDRFRGNFYKLCAGERPHQGSFAPADFTGEPFLPASSECFEVVTY